MTVQQVDARTMAREVWSTGDFDVVATTGTLQASPHLVQFAKIQSGERVLDLGTGTGMVALSARRTGAKVTGVDVAPALLERAAQHADTAGLGGIEWVEGDAVELPFPDASFDVVVSQFGHMFATPFERACAEMLRVLRPGGRIAFSTWPPEHYAGEMFALNARYAPAPPGPSPLLWGDPDVVRDRLGSDVKDLMFRRASFQFPAVSPQHYRLLFESCFGPTVRLVRSLEGDGDRLAAWRADWDRLITRYFMDNGILHEYLLTRAVKR